MSVYCFDKTLYKDHLTFWQKESYKDCLYHVTLLQKNMLCDRKNLIAIHMFIYVQYSIVRERTQTILNSFITDRILCFLIK
jgi:hypothetical protein